MKRLLIAALLMTPIVSFAQTGAKDAASNEQGNDYTLGGVSLATGGALAAATCPFEFGGAAALCAAGVSVAQQGVQNIMQGKGRGAQIDAFNPGDPTLPNLGGSGGSTSDSTAASGDSATPPFPPAVQEALDNAKNTFSGLGVDITNPQSVAAFQAKLGSQSGGGGDGGGSPKSLSDLPPDIAAKVEKAKDRFLTKYNVASVGIEGGGGHARQNVIGSDKNFDFNAILEGIGKKSDRSPASIEGLQKRIGDDQIGVAGDNIFKQVSRCYQSKIRVQTFLPPPANKK